MEIAAKEQSKDGCAGGRGHSVLTNNISNNMEISKVLKAAEGEGM
jgi:hypothetical protein